MSLQLETPETNQLVQELAGLTGESTSQAVTEAVREKLERLRCASPARGNGVYQRLMHLADEYTSIVGNHNPAAQLSLTHGDLL